MQRLTEGQGYGQLEAMAVNSEVLVSAHLSLSAILERVTIRAKELTGAEFAAFSTFDDDGLLDRFIYVGMDESLAHRMGSPPVGRGLLGELVSHERPIRLANLQDHPRFTGWPEGHPDMRAFLGVPVRAGHETIGALYMTRAGDTAPFTWEDELAAAVLAYQAAASLSNALAQARENRVALLEERVRIAHDLHDGTIQSLYAIGLQVDALASQKEIPADIREQLSVNVSRINGLIHDIRGYIETLRMSPVAAHPPELSRDLATIARDVVPAGIDVIVNITAPALQELSERAADDLVFIAREALSNAVRHGAPTKVAVDLRQDLSETALAIQDNGTGFDPAHITPGLGTVTMRTRAAHLGADLSIISVPGMGTTVRVSIPREADPDE